MSRDSFRSRGHATPPLERGMPSIGEKVATTCHALLESSIALLGVGVTRVSLRTRVPRCNTVVDATPRFRSQPVNIKRTVEAGCAFFDARRDKPNNQPNEPVCSQEMAGSR